jgi:hypothetical protein
MAAGGTERTSGYFGDQTPSESKSPVSVPHSVLPKGQCIFGVPHFRNPYLTKVTNQLDSTLLVTYADRYTFLISLELLK